MFLDCLNNYYGQNCAENCNEHHCSAGTVCSKSDGICPQGCDPGYTGDACIDGKIINFKFKSTKSMFIRNGIMS